MANTNIRKHLTEIGGGYYISKADPLYWHKLLRFKPSDGESLFHVGLDYEKEAKRNLLLYQRTKQSPFLSAYQLYMEKALDFTHRAVRNGYVKGRQDSLRIENTLKQSVDLENSSKTIKRRNPGPIILLLAIVISLMLGAFLFYLLEDGEVAINKQTVVNNNFASFIPVQIRHEKPPVLSQLTYYEESIYVDPSQSIPLEDALLNKLKETYKISPSKPIRIKAFDQKNGSERAIAIWNGPKSGVEAYIYPEAQVNPLLFESTTMLRSALYQFVQKNGYFPDGLEELTKPFPANYLSSIPKDPQNLSSHVTPIKDGTGGWVYQKPVGYTSNNIKLLVEKALEPNLDDLDPIAFEPLEITINKSSNRLVLKSGEKLLRSYPVALGMNGLTPEGIFIVQKRIAYPNKSITESVFGTRALELSNPSYAIHGTNDPVSIGKDVSHGCIRLNNLDIEELFSLVPLATPVNIVSKPDEDKGRVTISTMNPYISRKSSPDEENPSQIYFWNG